MIQEKVYNVVVTACAPFKGNERNPTQNVKLALPPYIKRKGRIPIRIIKYPVDFRNVITDMDIIPELWSGDKRVYNPDCKPGEKLYIDAMLHLGMNFADVWQIEKQARRDGYDWVGDDGVRLPRDNGGEDGRWEGFPEVLEPIFDVDHMAEQLRKEIPDIPTQISTDAGLLYCEFIFYTSLATLYEAEEPHRVMFLHHAGKKTTENDIKDGAKVAVSVISSMIDQLEKLEAALLERS